MPDAIADGNYQASNSNRSFFTRRVSPFEFYDIVFVEQVRDFWKGRFV